MAKVLIAVSCLVLATGAFAGMLGDLYEIPKTAVAPTIDGVMDPIWHNVGEVFQRSYTNGATVPDGYADLMGWSRYMYDDNNMYVLLYTQDDIIVDTHANTYERDSWEIYFDGDDSKGTSYDGVNDLQIRLGHAVSDVANLEAQSYWGRDGVEYAVLDNPAEAPSGWMTEVKLPLAGIFVEPVANSIIGFELQQNDNDGTSRESISKWWVSEGDPSWNNASTFGDAILTDRTVTEDLGVMKLPAGAVAPVIDGMFDPIYEASATPGQQNSFDNGGNPGNWPDSYEDNFARWWVTYDDNNFYAFLEAWDDIVIDAHANTYERDSFEVYFDGDNSKGASYDNVNDMQLRFGHWASTPDQIDAQSYFGRDGVEFVNFDTDMGWNCEIKLPFAGILCEPVLDSEFGFEVQQNDNDGTARDEVTKWWTEVGDPSWNNASGWGTAMFQAARTGVEEQAQVAKSFGLSQNYPNPFNPVTTIPYSLKTSGKVRLSVYDMMGKEIAVLVDGIRPAGSYTAAFSGSNLSSGIYFCKLQTADNVMTTKMTLVK